jgi:membrane carboxypeptidase/penicillin-binding protein
VLAAPAWTAMMNEVYERRTIPAAWARPAGLAALDIDKTTGYKATPFCPKDVHYIESFIHGTEPTQFCPVHSPFGSIGVLGGDSPEPNQNPSAPLTPTPPPAPGQPPKPETVTSGGTSGVMGGTGPTGKPDH